MKRREFVKPAGLGVVTGVLAKPAIAEGAPRVSWRLQSSYPNDGMRADDHRSS